MDFVNQHSFEKFNSLVARLSGIADLGRRALRVLQLAFQPHADTRSLNARLRRDAGLDEHEAEQAKARRAPLIR